MSIAYSLKDFELEMTDNGPEFSFVYRCCTGETLDNHQDSYDKWLLRDKNGHSFGFITVDYDTELKELEIRDCGIHNRFKLKPLISALKTLASGEIYKEAMVIAAIDNSNWEICHMLKSIGLEEFEPEDPWSEETDTYFIKEHK